LGPPGSQNITEPGEPPAKSRRRAIYWVISLLLAGVLLYFSLRGIEWLRVWTVVRGARLLFVALALGTVSLALFARSIRWRVLLTAEGKVPVRLAFWATAAGYFGNNVLPARAGEVVRSLMISRYSGFSKAFVLTTALSERVVDAIVLISVSALVLLTLPTRPGWLGAAARPFALIGLVGVAAIVLVPVFESFWFRTLERIPIPAGLRIHIESALRQVLRGIRSFHDGSRLSRFLLLTTGVWCLDVVTAIVTAHAIGLSIQVRVAFLLLAGLGLGSALPSTPGYVGIYQFVAVSILSPFGFSKTDAIAYIILLQAILYLVILTWGLIGLGQQRKIGVTSVDTSIGSRQE
jgi:uncharacterized protein (TIRG00374 family)